MMRDIHLARAYGMGASRVKRLWPVRGRVFLALEPWLRDGAYKSAVVVPVARHAFAVDLREPGLCGDCGLSAQHRCHR